MATLSGIERGPRAGGKPDSLMIMLHGLGSRGATFEPSIDVLAPAFPHMQFYAPNAPLPYDPAQDPKNPRGAADPNREDRWWWYSRYSEETRVAGLYAVAEHVNGFIDERMAHHGVDATRTIVFGFSQGCITALNVIPRRPTALAGMIAHSGYLFSPDSLPQRKQQRARFMTEIASKTPTCCINGIEDLAQSWKMNQEAALVLDEAGVPVEFHLVGGLGHAISKQTLAIVRDFTERHLAR